MVPALDFRKVMAILKEEGSPNPQLKEDWYLDLLTDKSLSGGNSDLQGEPGPGKAYCREEFIKSDSYPDPRRSNLFIENLLKELGTKGAIKVIAFLWVLFFFVVAFESTQQQWFEGMPVVDIILLIATIAALAVTFFGTIIQWMALTERIYKKQFSRQSLLSLLKWFGATGALVMIIKTITLVS